MSELVSGADRTAIEDVLVIAAYVGPQEAGKIAKRWLTEIEARMAAAGFVRTDFPDVATFWQRCSQLGEADRQSGEMNPAPAAGVSAADLAAIANAAVDKIVSAIAESAPDRGAVVIQRDEKGQVIGVRRTRATD